jgi:hypothetical protein
MSSADEILTRRFARLEKTEKCDLSRIEDYLGFKDTENEKLSISLQKKNTHSECLLTIRYLKKEFDVNNHGVLKKLPEDIIQEISEYLNYDIEIGIRVTFTIHFPFESPEWKILHINQAFNKNINRIRTLAYLQGKINDITCNWPPTMFIEKQIVIFLINTKLLL